MVLFRGFIALLTVCTASALVVSPNNIDGTETTTVLTDKQLAIQRWFSQITFLQDLDDWNGWGDVIEDVHCDGNWCIRYEIAGLVYGVSALALKTPAYTQVNEKILFNAIQRMTDKLVYQYIEIFGDFTDQPTFPDPVIYKNIMYSGHLAQMISLYESITGDMTFSTDGWQFDWGSTSDFPIPINYTTSKLIDNMFKQSQSYEIGGVPCEPDSIFIICNNYMVNALHLFDANHNSSYESAAAPLWQSTVEKKGINKVPPVPGMDNNYFNLDYLIKPLGIWEPIASVGSDAWALAWMKTWWNNDNSHDSEKKLASAFDAIYGSAQWVNESVDDGTSMHLHSTDASAKLIPLNDMITTSFYPMIEKQFFTASCVQSGGCLSKIESVHRYFESNMGRYFDSDADGVLDSYHYNTALMMNTSTGDSSDVIGNYTVWVTANLLLGMMTEELSQSVLQELFQYSSDKSVPYFQRFSNQPKVLEVEYPKVMVSSAVFTPAAADSSCGNLNFSLVAGDNCVPKGSVLTVLLRGDADKISGVTLNGAAISSYSKGSVEGTVELSASAVWESCTDGSRMEFVVSFD